MKIIIDIVLAALFIIAIFVIVYRAYKLYFPHGVFGRHSSVSKESE